MRLASRSRQLKAAGSVGIEGMKYSIRTVDRVDWSSVPYFPPLKVVYLR